MLILRWRQHGVDYLGVPLDSLGVNWGSIAPPGAVTEEPATSMSLMSPNSTYIFGRQGFVGGI